MIDQIMQLAMLLQTLDDLQMEKDEYLRDWKARYEKIFHERVRVTRAIITGQKPLPLEKVEP